MFARRSPATIRPATDVREARTSPAPNPRGDVTATPTSTTIDATDAATTDATTTASAQPSASRLGALLRNPWLLGTLLAVAAGIYLWAMVRPLDRVVNDADSISTVVYWQRLASLHRLEAYVPTTPKPLLSFLYGIAWFLTSDWRSLTVLSVVAGGLAVGLAGRLGWRFAGPAGAVVVTIALLAWPPFAYQVARGNSMVWALMLWSAAGVLMTGDRPRPWLAGVALLLAGLARPETIYLLGGLTFLAGFTLVLDRQASPHLERYRRFRSIAPVLIGFAFVPVTCLLDWLMTGSLFYWLGVPASYTTLVTPGARPPSLITMAHQIAGHYKPALLLLPFAGLGVLRLVVSKRRAACFAILALIGGVLAGYAVLGWRGTFLTTRYYEEADGPMILLIALGAAWLVEWAAKLAAASLRPLRSLRPATVPAVSAVAGGILALAVVGAAVPTGTLDPQLRGPAAWYDALERAMPQVEPLLAGAVGEADTVRGVNFPVADPARSRMYVPRAFVGVISTEAHVPLTAVGDSYLAFRGGHYADLSPGQYVLHIRGVDLTDGTFAPFEGADGHWLDTGTGTGTVRLTPVIADPGTGLWLWRVDPPASAG